MRAAIFTVENHKTIRVAAGRHILIADFDGLASHAFDEAGPWGTVAEFQKGKAVVIESGEGWLEIENWHEGHTGKFGIGKAN